VRYIRLVIEYDGTRYLGWQSQKSGGTIQDILGETILGILGEKVRLTGASRTDAGVHALGQTAVFATASGLEHTVVMRALNAKLPRDIRITDAEEVDGSFHPRYNAIKKSYFYLISTDKRESAFLHPFLWELKTGLDTEANAFLRHMARNIVGTLVEVGRGRISTETVGDILRARDRRKAGPTAPAKGLFLEKITY
jgi:tRNA pseudouridine38-40 synthase